MHFIIVLLQKMEHFLHAIYVGVSFCHALLETCKKIYRKLLRFAGGNLNNVPSIS